MSGFWKIFCVGSTIGGVSGLVPAIGVAKTSNKNNLNETVVKKMHKHGVGQTQVCFGFKTDEAKSELKPVTGKDYRLVFWFQPKEKADCESFTGRGSSKEIQQIMNGKGYWRVDLSKDDVERIKEREKGLYKEKWRAVEGELDGKLAKLKTKNEGLEENEQSILTPFVGALTEINVGEWT